MQNTDKNILINDIRTCYGDIVAGVLARKASREDNWISFRASNGVTHWLFKQGNVWHHTMS